MSELNPKTVKTIYSIGDVPDDVLSVIFGFIPYYYKNWLHVILVCKRFLRVGQKTFDPSVENNKAIVWASMKGDLNLVTKLLRDPRVDPSTMENHSIFGASANGHYKVVRMLLGDPRVDPRIPHNSILHWPCKNGHIKVVRELLKDSRINPSEYYNTAIIAAMDRGRDYGIDIVDNNIVRELLKDPRTYCKINIHSFWDLLFL